MPLRVLDNHGEGFDSDIARAIVYAADHGANAINMSLGGPEPSKVLDNAIAYARARNVVVVCAAGNSGADLDWPGASTGCIPVRALTAGGSAITEWSSRGTSADGRVHGVSAPGSAVWSLLPQNGYTAMDGTSMATPIVSAAAGALVAAGQTDDSAQQLIESSARDLDAPGPDALTGYGTLDLAQLAHAAAGEHPRSCRARKINLRPGRTSWDIDLTGLCDQTTLQVMRKIGPVRLEQTGSVLHASVTAARQWQMNRAVIELGDDPALQNMTLTIGTPPQAVDMRINGRRCGQSLKTACRVRYGASKTLPVIGRWKGAHPPGTVVRLRMERLIDGATDSAGTRMGRYGAFHVSLKADDFGQGDYSITPSRGQLLGRTFYLRVS
jgi:hypothetical protein